MKQIFIACSLVFMSSIATSSATVSKNFTGRYMAVERSLDQGKTWEKFDEYLATFEESKAIYQDTCGDDGGVPYRRVLYSYYNNVYYMFIQLDFNNIAQITKYCNGQYLVVYLQNGKETERYKCKRMQ